MIPSRALTALALLTFGGSGCIAYNEPCGGLSENKDEVVGYVTGKVYLDKNNARHANNAIARVAAESFIDAFKDSSAPAQLGILNGGSIRNEGGTVGPDGQCLTRNVLAPAASEESPAKVTSGDIHQIMLFQNQVYAIDLTEAELYQVMEHSASGLTPATGGAVTSPSGRFLDIAGGTLRIDCSRAPGDRVTLLKVGDQELQRDGARLFRVALSEYLLRGGDGYAMIDAVRANPERNPAQAQVHGGIDNDLAAAFMKETYGTPETALHVWDATDRVSCTKPELTQPDCQDGPGAICCHSPIALIGCAVPGVPEP